MVLLAAGCGSPAPPGAAPAVRVQLERGRRAAEAWLARAAREDPPADEVVVALGYLERHRLGLGSPFRLADQALHDPRLPDSTRADLARALLDGTRAGAGYRIDPAALDRIGVAGLGYARCAGERHLALIEGAVTGARDPRTGEVAVRIAYALAAAEGSAGAWAPQLAAQAAAQLRDRELARADARRLIATADAGRADVLVLLRDWRAQRRFAVERPIPRLADPAREREAIELAHGLLPAIRALAPAMGGGAGVPAACASPAPILGTAAAARLSALADSLELPPQAPVAVAVSLYRRELLDRPDLPPARKLARRRFLTASHNEEKLAAERAILVRLGDPDDGASAMAALRAAVALRAFGQEPVWFPGSRAPDPRDVQARYGLAAFRFDPAVPAAWRPYYARMLDRALAELRLVLPTLSVRGLRVEVAERRPVPTALASHQPRTRTLTLPPRTGAGTIAHEIAHDLDWQLALRRYGVRGAYATDRVARRTRDRLALQVRALSLAPLVPPDPGNGEPHHARRPAEVFARRVDGLVADALAADGIVAGYLTSIQDDLLTGYGSVRPRELGGSASAALLAILDAIAPVPPERQARILAGDAPSAAIAPYDLVRRVIEGAPLPDSMPTPTVDVAPANGATGVVQPLPALRLPLDAIRRARDAALAAIDLAECAAPWTAGDIELQTARRRLVHAAAGARARGMLLEYAGHHAGADGRRWAARQLYGAPWPAAPRDSTLAALFRAWTDDARTLEAYQPAAGSGFRLRAEPQRCPQPVAIATGLRITRGGG